MGPYRELVSFAPFLVRALLTLPRQVFKRTARHFDETESSQTGNAPVKKRSSDVKGRLGDWVTDERPSQATQPRQGFSSQRSVIPVQGRIVTRPFSQSASWDRDSKKYLRPFQFKMEPSYLMIGAVICGALLVVRGEMTQEMKDMAKMLHEQCIDETGTNEDTVEAAIKGNLADDPKLKCYMKCLFVQMGVMDADDGTLDFDAFAAVLPDDLQESAGKGLAHCKDKIGGADACEVAYSLNTCLHKFDPAHYMLI